MRICVVYDCLYPYTIGGAERWYRDLAVELARRHHSVTYITLRQWDPGVVPTLDGVTVVAVGPRFELYGGDGRRRIVPPLVFGLGVLWYLVRHGRRFDVVHTASFPYFSLLAAGVVRPFWRFRLSVDWHEVWTQDYWREYLGPVGGRVGWAVQRLCLGLRQQPFCFSRLHALRLLECGVDGDVVRLEGQYAGSSELAEPTDAETLVVFVGRQIPEKRVLALVPAIRLARARVPELRGEIFGDGPDRARLLQSIVEHDLSEVVSAPGFVDSQRVHAALGRALCLVLPSRREGYGRVIVEAAATGTPAVVVAGPDNAAVELVEDGRNGFIAPSVSPEDIADAIVRVYEAGETLRESTREWFRMNAERLSLARSVEAVAAFYEPATASTQSRL